MKSGTPFHPKTRKLARELSMPIYAAVGILEMLWHFTEKFCPAGNIGKVDDQDIADAVDWTGETPTLIDALVNSKWIDRHEHHRLVVHDWFDHCNDSTHLKLARAAETFAGGQVPKLARLSKHERESIEQTYAHMHINVHKSTLPCPPLPSPPKPSHALSSSAAPKVSEPADPPTTAKPPTFQKPTPSQIESLYHAYPRKVGKQAALKAIKSAIDRLHKEGRDALTELLDRVMAYAKATGSADRQFIPHPATWFNAGRYDDDPSEWDRQEEQDPEEDEGGSMEPMSRADRDRLFASLPKDLCF